MTTMKVLLTADRTLMSNYRNDEFLGFGITEMFSRDAENANTNIFAEDAEQEPTPTSMTYKVQTQAAASTKNTGKK